MPDQAVFPWQIWSGWERKRNRRTAEPLGKRSVLEAEPIGIVIKMSSESESETTQGDLGQLGIFGPVRRQAADFVEKPVPAAPSRPPAALQWIAQPGGAAFPCDAKGGFVHPGFDHAPGRFHCRRFAPAQRKTPGLFKQPFRLPAHVRPSGWRAIRQTEHQAETRAEAVAQHGLIPQVKQAKVTGEGRAAQGEEGNAEGSGTQRRLPALRTGVGLQIVDAIPLRQARRSGDFAQRDSGDGLGQRGGEGVRSIGHKASLIEQGGNGFFGLEYE